MLLDKTTYMPLWGRMGFTDSEENLIEELGLEEVATGRRRDLEQKEKKRNRSTEVICRGKL